MNVELTDSAKADLEDLRRYLMQYKPRGTWLVVKEQLRKQFSHLSQFPDAGSIPMELAEYSNGFRQILTAQQRIIYKTVGDTLYIHVICGQAQNLQEVLIKRLTRP